MIQDITITWIKIGEYPMSIPIGLSELVNKSSAWSTEKSPPLEGYTSETLRMDGKLITRITKVRC